MENVGIVAKCAFTLDAKQHIEKVCYLHEWSFKSLAQNRPTKQKQFCLSKVLSRASFFNKVNVLVVSLNDVLFARTLYQR